MRLWWLATLALSGCFYLEVINVQPVARIERVTTGPVYSEGMVELSAAPSTDENGDGLAFDWSASRVTTIGEFASDQVERFKFRLPTGHESVHVALTVTDSHGAVGMAFLELAVSDRAPEAKLQVQTLPNGNGTFTVTRPIVFAASATDPDSGDADGLTYTFALHPPPDSDPNKATSSRDGQLFTIVPDVPGSWEVEVTARDAYGMSGVARQSVTVGADAPPCIAATSPVWSPGTRIIIPRAGGPRRFSMESVSDDLDGYPGSGIHFRWLASMPGSSELVEVSGHDLPDLVVDPTDLDPGDVLSLRVEVADRVTRTLPCGLEQAACSLSSNSCLQRVTWTVEVR